MILSIEHERYGEYLNLDHLVWGKFYPESDRMEAKLTLEMSDGNGFTFYGNDAEQVDNAIRNEAQRVALYG